MPSCCREQDRQFPRSRHLPRTCSCLCEGTAPRRFTTVLTAKAPPATPNPLHTRSTLSGYLCRALAFTLRLPTAFPWPVLAAASGCVNFSTPSPSGPFFWRPPTGYARTYVRTYVGSRGGVSPCQSHETANEARFLSVPFFGQSPHPWGKPFWSMVLGHFTAFRQDLRVDVRSWLVLSGFAAGIMASLGPCGDARP